MTPPSRIHALLDAVAGGDRRACEAVYRLSSPKIYGLTLRLVRDPELADAAMRETYGRIFAAAHQIDPREDPLCWMVAIARDCALDIVRSRPGVTSWEPFTVDEPAADPLAGDRRSIALTRLLSCLGGLSEERRRMVLLAFYDGWGRDALSVYFDVPEAVLRAWLARSVNELDVRIGPRP